MRKIALFTVLCNVLMLIIGLTGCSLDNESDAKPQKGAVSFVIANTACSQGLNFNNPLVQDTAYEVIRNFGYIDIINADACPYVMYSQSFDIDDRYKSASKEKLDMEARSKNNDLISAMQNIIADDPETDYLEALRIAARSLSSLENYDYKSIVVIGTGLSTSGVLNFQNNLLSSEASVIVELLKEKEEIPDFSGINVYWAQLGDVALPQKKLTAAQQNKLRDIYNGIIEAGGGTFIYNSTIASPVNENVDYPKVTPIELPTDTPIVFEPNALQTAKDDKAFEEPKILNESQIEFVGDQAVYLYPDKAVENISPIAEYLKDYKSIQLLLIGSTAGDVTDERALSLSQERADAVKNTIVSLGVDSSRIITVGMGSDDPWHITNAGFEGAAASSNRKVVLLDTRSDTAQEIIKNYNLQNSR